MTDVVNPDDFVIARKRKKYRFAKFHNADNCYELEEWKKQPIDVLEIGAGTGLFSVELAKKHPQIHYAALDVKADRLQKGAHEAIARGITNISFIRARADQITELCDPESLAGIWLTFPDPFPKNRSSGRRLTHPHFLRLYSSLLRPEGSLYLKHDNQPFFQWSLEQLVNSGWEVRELSFDLHESMLDSDYKTITTYEKRWLSDGLQTQFVRVSKPENND